MSRAYIPLSTGWRFLRDEEPAARLADFDDTSWQPVSVPHSFNAEDTFAPRRGPYRGPAWYRRSLPALPERSRIVLDALGAFALTHVWVNGTLVGEYMGGFTGFAADLTPHLRRDGTDVLAIRVSNQHNPDILPGKRYPDYYLYGGIYREIGLVVTDPLRIDRRGLVVSTPDVSDERGTVRLDVRVRNDRSRATRGRVKVAVRDPGNAVVASGDTPFSIAARTTETVTVPLPPVERPMLWSPDSPVRYRIEVVIAGENGHEIDADEIEFGFRFYRFDVDRGFFINGRPLKLRGVNRHQDYPGLGNAIPAQLQSYDVELIRELGGNFVRCSHYPMHPAFLDACDRLGVLVYEEIASWQFIGGQAFARNAETMMQEMIARDRHHPSIILWGLLNEGRNAQLFARLHRVAKECDPDRPTTYAENNPKEGMALGTTTIPDVLGLNYLMDELDAIRVAVPGKPMFSSEHTNDGPPRGDFAKEIRQMYRILADLDRFERRAWIAGSALWSMHDYGTDADIVWPIQKSGIFDAWRLPKPSAHAIRAVWSADPFIRILGHWNHTGVPGGDPYDDARLPGNLKYVELTGPAPAGMPEVFDNFLRREKPVPVIVASNAPEVELFLDDRSFGRRTAADGFYWFVDYAPGTLRAVGAWSDGKTATDEIATAGYYDDRGAVVLEPLHDSLRANGVDVTLVTARIVDQEGRFAPTAAVPVSFRVELGGFPGGADVCGVGGVSGFVTVAGVGRIAVRAGTRPGRLRIVAEGTALRQGEAWVDLRKA